MNALAQAREVLLRRPSLLDTQRAARRVVQRQTKCSPDEAKKLLDGLSQANVIIDIYKAAMPDEFKREKGSRLAIAQRFWKRLGFPIWEEGIREHIKRGAKPHPLSAGIPIMSLSGHLCPNCYHFESMPLDYQVAALLTKPESLWGDDEDDEATEGEREEVEYYWAYLAKRYELAAELKPVERIEVNDFETPGITIRSPLRFIPLLTRSVDYNTGCIFFDFDPNEGAPDDLMWTPKNVAWLRKQYTEAKIIRQQLESLAEWFETKPRERVIQALKLYHNIRQAHAKTNLKRVADAERRALVRVL